MTRLHRALRRTGVITAASLALAGLPVGPTAFAATGTVTSASPAFVANTGAATMITFDLSDEVTSPGELVSVTLSGPGGTTVTETGNPNVQGDIVEATFDLRGIAPGLYGVRVADASGGNLDEFECTSCLRVLATPPSLTAVTPAKRGASSPASTFVLSGTNIFAGATVRFLREGSYDSTITFPATGSVTVSNDNRSATGTIAVAAGSPAGVRDVEITNTDGQRTICEDCLTITPAPAFVSLTPAVAGQGAQSRALTLLGAEFQPTMTAAFFVPASTTDNGGVTVSSFTMPEPGVANLVVNVADRSDTTSVQRDLVLTNPDGGTTRVSQVLTVTPEPTVSALTPSTLDGGASTENLVVTGANLAASPTFVFSGSGVTVNDYTPDSATAATKGVLNVTVAKGASVSGRTLTIQNPDGGRSTSGTVLTVGATPTVTSVSPSSLGRGTVRRQITINGSNFDTSNTGLNVSVTIPGITLADVVATSTSTIVANATVPGDAAVGLREVSVLNTAAGRRGRATCACFSVDNFAVDSVAPSAVLNSAVYSIDVSGSGMPAGEAMTATLTRSVNRAGQDAIVFQGTVNNDGTRFTGSADLRDMAPGTYQVRLTRGDQESGTCSCVFNIVAERTPSLTQVSPSSAPQGSTGRELTLTGAGFTRGADVRFGTGVTKSGPVTFVNNTTLKVPVDVAPTATAAAVPVTVLIPSFTATDTEATCGACFTVTRRPTVSSVSRASRGQGAGPAGVTVTGTDFQPGATVTAGDGVLVSDVVRVSPTQLTFTATVAEDAVPGARTITVTNPDGGIGTCACFGVTPRPLASSLSPATGGQGRGSVPVTLNGSGFQAGAGVSFGEDVRVVNVTGSGETLSVTLDLTNARLGAHQVSVANPDGGAATCACEFTVFEVPTITGLTPSSRGAGAVEQTVTIMGTKFTPTATVAFADPGITVVDSDVVDAFRIDAVVSIAPNVTPGARSVTVTNLDTGQSADCSACFTVNAAPTVTAAEHTAQRNRKNVTTTFAGSGFQPGAIGALLGDGVTVKEANATTPTSATVTFDVGPAASLGKRDVVLVNGDGGRATCTQCLTITTPRVFTISGDASPVSGAAQTVTVTAHVSSDEGSATDTSYTGVPVLFAAGDSHFSGGTCAAAVAGVSTCENVRFGDLGPAQLNAMGTGADDDLGGTRAVTVEPVALTFSPTPPRTAKLGSPVSVTVRPVAGVTGADISDYAAARTAHLTGHTEPSVPLQCSSAICTFSVTFTSTGRKTVRVTDDSSPNATTPTATVTVPIATTIPDFRVSRTIVTAGQSITMAGTLRDVDGRALGGREVRIYITGSGYSSWVLWQRLTTASDGTFRKTVTMARTRSLKAVYVPAEDAYARADSRTVTVGVRTKISVTSPASGTRVAAGRTFSVRGGTYPPKPGVTAYLVWRRSDGSTFAIATSRIRSDGRYVIYDSLRSGTYTLQVRVRATPGNLAGQSPYFTLRVV